VYFNSKSEVRSVSVTNLIFTLRIFISCRPKDEFMTIKLNAEVNENWAILETTENPIKIYRRGTMFVKVRPPKNHCSLGFDVLQNLNVADQSNFLKELFCFKSKNFVFSHKSCFKYCLTLQKMFFFTSLKHF
jgi:hypothetical protein